MDKATGLSWMRCALGQTWHAEGQTGAPSAGRCEGQAQQLELSAAEAQIRQLNAQKYLGIAHWRLPTIVELAALRQCDHGLVDDTFELDLSPEQAPLIVKRWCKGETSSPTIDSARFPDTPQIKFWSGSGSETHQFFYAVDFSNAWIGLNEDAKQAHAVRAVADAVAPAELRDGDVAEAR